MTPSDAVLDLFTAECNTIHALCDERQVPREFDGQALSMAQRVEILAAVNRAFVRSIGHSPNLH